MSRMDSRWRGNDGGLGAMNRAPTSKTYPCEGGLGGQGAAAAGCGTILTLLE